jgi:magnesium transporter
MDGLPTMTTQTFIGILVAITGNVLISLALNLQKVAHKRVETLRKALNRKSGHSENDGYNNLSQSRVSEGPSLDEHDEDRELLDIRTQLNGFSDSPSEIQPLISVPRSEPTLQHYGTDVSRGHSTVTKPLEASRFNVSWLLPTRFFSKNAASGRRRPPEDNVPEEQGLLLPIHKDLDVESEADHQNPEEGDESYYLKSRIWWTAKICQFD